MSIIAEIPLPIQVVIDDVGWWCGANGSAYGEPFRTGIARDHVPADYEAIASLGRQLNIRPQAAFILCEWDKHNILRELPSCTWMGEAWDNRRWVGPWQEEAASIVRDNRAHMELTLHGIGHEYWAAGEAGEWNFTRAEWCDADGNMRPPDAIMARLDYYQRLLDQHDLGPFPTSFVPCAFFHRYEPRATGVAALLGTAGINFISSPYSAMSGAEELAGHRFGYDHDIMTVDRGDDLQDWFWIGTPPEGELTSPICGMHWPNLLHLDPAQNEAIVTAWVDYLRAYENRVDRMLAADTTHFATQLTHHVHTTVGQVGDRLMFDFSAILQLPQAHFTREFTVKILAPTRLELSPLDLDIIAVNFTETSTGILHQVTVQPAVGSTTAELHWVPKAFAE